MITLKTSDGLQQLLMKQIDRIVKDFKIFAGHLPLLYDDQKRVQLDSKRWGPFSEYTLELGCELARYAKQKGKSAMLLIVVDDLVEVPRDVKGKRSFKKWMLKAQRIFYSGNEFPVSYEKILGKYGMDKHLVMQRRSFGKSRLISERKLKTKFLDSEVSNECSMAYSAMLNDSDLIKLDKEHLISFIPGQCKGNICEGVLDVRKDLNSTHVFFPHVEMMGGLLETKEEFVSVKEAASLQDIFNEGVVCRFTEAQE